MAQFSGAVKIGDLNDFIAPAQACIVNVDGTPKTGASKLNAQVRRYAAACPVCFSPERRDVEERQWQCACR